MKLRLHKKGMKRLLAIILLFAVLLPLGISGTAKPLNVEAAEESVVENVKEYNLYDLLGEMSTYLGPNVTKYLGGTDTATNVSVILDVDAETAGESVYYIGKENATNEKDATGYAIQVWPRWEGVAIYKGTVATENLLASGSIPKASGRNSYTLEYGIADVKDGNGSLIGRTIYVKHNGQEVLTYSETNLNHTVGTHVWAYASGVEGAGASLKCNMSSYMNNSLVADKTTEYNLFDFAEKFTTYIGPNVTQYLGATDSNKNISVVLDVNAETPGEIVYYIGKDNSENVSDQSGYAIQVWPRWEGIAIYKGAVATENLLASGSIPKTTKKLSYQLEIGIVDMKNDTNTIVGRKVYAKFNGEEKVAYLDINIENSLGKNVFVYASGAEGAGAGISCDVTSVINKFKADSATEHNLFDLASAQTIAIPGNDTKYLGTTSSKTNFSVALEVKADTPGETVYYIGKDSATDVTDASGYAIQVWPRWEGIAIYKGTVATENLLASGSITKRTNGFTFELEIGIVDLRNDADAIVGRKVYAKFDGEEKVAYFEANMDNATGKHVWAYASGAEGGGATLNCDMTSVMNKFKAESASQQNLFEVSGAQTIALPGNEIKYLGTTSGKTNISVLLEVKASTPGETLYYIGKDSSKDVKDTSGYVVQVWPRWEGINIYKGTVATENLLASASIPKSSKGLTFELEIGIVNMKNDAGTVVGRKIYAKYDGEEKVAYFETDLNNATGKHVWAYASGEEGGGATLNCDMSSVINKYKADSAKEYNLFDLAEKFSTYLGPNVTQYIGATDSNKNISVAVDVNAETPGEIVYYIGKDNSKDVNDASGYAIQVWPRWEGISIYKGTVATENLLASGSIPKATAKLTYQLEIGIVDMKDDAGTVVGRKIYAKYNGEEKVACLDAGKNHKIGKHVWAYANGQEGAGVSLICDTEGILKGDSMTEYGFEKLTGNTSLGPMGQNVTYLVGTLDMASNVSFKLKVSATDKNEYIFTLAKESTTTVYDGTGYQFRIRPAIGQIAIYQENNDWRAAIENCEIPENYELEIGLYDMRDASGKLWGRTVYAKIDGKQVILYEDFDVDHKLGTNILLRTGTNNSIKLMDANYIVAKLPVSYIVNGQKVETTEWMSANTEVVIGAESYIILTKNPTIEMMPQIQAVYLNGERIDVARVSQNHWSYFIKNPKLTDKLVVELSTKKLTSDAPATILDLYEISGKTEISVGLKEDVGLGIMMKDNTLYHMNAAVRFSVQFPQEAVSRLKIGWNADQSDVWNTTGYTVEFNEGLVKFMFGTTEDILNSNTCDLIKPGATVVVEIGTVKCYEEGVYTYNRHYVKAGTSVDNMKLITWYDSTNRGMFGQNVIARGSDGDFTYYIRTTKTVVGIEDTSDASQKANIGTFTNEKGEEQLTVYYPKTLIAGESAKIVIYTKEGFKLNTLTVGGKVVTPTILFDGSYVYQIESVNANTKFSYTLEEDTSTYKVTGKDSDNVKILIGKGSVIAAGSTEVQIKVEKGYALDKILINGEDYTAVFRYDALEGAYVGTISGIREDKEIEVSAVKEEKNEPISSVGVITKDDTAKTPGYVVAIIIAAATLCLVGAGMVIVIVLKRKKGSVEIDG